MELGTARPPFIAALAATLVFSSMVAAERYGLITLPVPTDELIASVLPGAVVALTNEERQDEGVGNVRANALLNRAAQMKADDMARKSYYAHVSPDGTVPPYWLNQVGYRYQIMGENLVIDRENSDQVVSAWMGSQSHRDNLLNPQFTEIGVGVAYGEYQGRDTIYVVQMLARPLGGTRTVARAEPEPAPVRTPASEPTPASTPRTVLPVLTPRPEPAPPRAPEPAPVVRDPLAPILTTLSSTTLAEVPNIVASSTYALPALAAEAGEPVALEPASTSEPRPSLGTVVRAFMSNMARDLRSFFSPVF